MPALRSLVTCKFYITAKTKEEYFYTFSQSGRVDSFHIVIKVFGIN